MHLNKKAVVFSISIGFLIGGFTAITIVQNLTVIREHIAEYIKTRFLQTAQCNFQTEVTACSLLPFTITCHNVHVIPASTTITSTQSPEWSWHCRKLTFNISWLGFIFFHKLITTIEAEDLIVYSTADLHTIAISEHLQKILLSNILKLPTNIKSLKINHARCTFAMPKYQIQTYIELSGLSKKNGKQFKSAWYFNNGAITCKNIPYIDHLNGSLHSNLVNKQPKTVSLKTTAFVHMAPDQQDLLYTQAEFDGTKWVIQIHNQEHSLIADIRTEPEHTTISTTCTSKLLCTIAHIPMLDFFNDTISINAFIKPSWQAQGTIKFEKLPLSCYWQYTDQTLTADLATTTTVDIPTSHWCIKPSTKLMHCLIKPKTLHATFMVPLVNTVTGKQCDNYGNCIYKHNTITNTAHIGSYIFKGNGTITPLVAHCLCTNKQGNKAFTLRASLENQNINFNMRAVYHEIMHIIPEPWKALFAGNGTVAVDGTLGWPISQLSLKLENACIFLGKSYNMCRALKATTTINHQTKHIFINNAHAKLHYGTLACPQARLDFNTQWHIMNAHIPITLTHCLINWNKNVSVCSGAMIFTYQKKQPQLHAKLTIDRAYLSSALAAQIQQQNTLAHTIASMPLNLHLSIETKKSFYIELPGLHSKAHARLMLDGPLTNPVLSGVITLDNGIIQLPSGNFTIVSGIIQLAPDHLDNSLIELLAKATIAHHDIMLQVFGTLKNPIMKLTSIPALAEQQIVALMLAGVPEQSLNTLLPTLITEQIKHLLTAKAPALNKQEMFDTSNRIKLTPRFSDPTGSGIHGGIEVDFNERLKAKIQKNLDLQENFTIEFDYKLSDELNLKAFKNEQGQMGGQASLRFKW